MLSAAVLEIMERAGLTADQVDTHALQIVLDGFVLHERVTARAAIDQLMQAFFFTVKESAGETGADPARRIGGCGGRCG